MTLSRLWFWSVVAATLTVYAVMVAWTLPRIASEAGGLPPFDMRPMGYSAQQAMAFLGALSGEGRSLYLGLQHKLDLVFPALAALSFILSFRYLFSGAPAALFWVLAACSVAGAGFDYMENFRVAGLLRTPLGDVSDAAIGKAAQATVMKSALNTGCGIALVVGIAVHAVNRMRRRA
jgi:hypothetical protein